MADSVSLLFTGDFFSGGKIEDYIKDKKFGEIFNDFTPISRNCDISITNLEAPLIDNGRPINKTGPVIKLNPVAVDALKFAGFDMVTLANNHIMDYGKDGLKKTVKLLDKNKIGFCGAGMDFQQASEIKKFNLSGKNIALLNFAENEWATTTGNFAGANPLNPVGNYYQIKNAKSSSDFVFVVIHGGHEMYQLPSPRMQETYRFFIDSGADAVIGHHTHCYSGYEIYNGHPIFYSLGNFLFENMYNKSKDWNTGFAVLFNIKDEKISFNLLPYFQNNNGIGLRLMSPDEENFFNAQISKLNSLINNKIQLQRNFFDFVSNNKELYNYYLEPYSNRYFAALRRWSIIPTIWSRRKRKYLLNLIRCESHRDFVINMLENEISNTSK